MSGMPKYHNPDFDTTVWTPSWGAIGEENEAQNTEVELLREAHQAALAREARLRDGIRRHRDDVEKYVSEGYWRDGLDEDLWKLLGE